MKPRVYSEQFGRQRFYVGARGDGTDPRRFGPTRTGWLTAVTWALGGIGQSRAVGWSPSASSGGGPRTYLANVTLGTIGTERRPVVAMLNRAEFAPPVAGVLLDEDGNPRKARPRLECPKCGKDVAVSAIGKLMPHREPNLRPGNTRVNACPGSAQKVSA